VSEHEESTHAIASARSHPRDGSPDRTGTRRRKGISTAASIDSSPVHAIAGVGQML